MNGNFVAMSFMYFQQMCSGNVLCKFSPSVLHARVQTFAKQMIRLLASQKAVTLLPVRLMSLFNFLTNWSISSTREQS